MAGTGAGGNASAGGNANASAGAGAGVSPFGHDDVGAYGRGVGAYRTPLDGHDGFSPVPALRGGVPHFEDSQQRGGYQAWSPGLSGHMSHNGYTMAGPSLGLDVELELPTAGEDGPDSDLEALPHGVETSPGGNDSEPASKRKQLAPVRGNTDGSGAPPAKMARLEDDI